MSIHVEWSSAKKSGFGEGGMCFVEPGIVQDSFGTTNTQPAIAGEGFCVEGTYAELEDMLLDVLIEVRQMNYRGQ